MLIIFQEKIIYLIHQELLLIKMSFLLILILLTPFLLRLNLAGVKQAFWSPYLAISFVSNFSVTGFLLLTIFMVDLKAFSLFSRSEEFNTNKYLSQVNNKYLSSDEISICRMGSPYNENKFFALIPILS